MPTIDENKFAGKDDGIALPARYVRDGAFRLEIANLDKADPPAYTPNGVPRLPAFNRNVLAMDLKPAMPELAVTCNVDGFTPKKATPIFWRLQTLHVLGRFTRKGPKGHYVSRVVSLADEWTGSSTSAAFTLFGLKKPAPDVVYDNLTDRVAGGHAILTVAAQPAAGAPWLQDFVHLRITGTNPKKATIRDYLHQQLSGRTHGSHLEAMLNAIFAWEANSKQFSSDKQTQTHFHGVPFNWPDDPADFPVASFDFGVGISQFTRPAALGTRHAWDWRRNIDEGVNVFFGKLRTAHKPGMMWDKWAHAGWRAYNGSGPDAEAYAVRLGKSPDGKSIPNNQPVPDAKDLKALLKDLDNLTPAPPANWPVTGAQERRIVTAALAGAQHAAAAQAIADAASRIAGDQQTLSWLWPRVVDDLHAARDHDATHVIPGVAAADLSAAVAGMNKTSVDALADRAFGLAFNQLRVPTPGFAPTPELFGLFETPADEFQRLSPFVRKNVGNGTVADWGAIRTMALEQFGSPPADVDTAIARINTYYDAFIDGQLGPGGPKMRVHADMKARFDDTRALLKSKNIENLLAQVKSIGGFNIRKNANNAHALSNHSFGIAIDLDPTTNPNMPLDTPAGERDNWVKLVNFLTGVDPYGAQSTALRTMRTYAKTLPDVQSLAGASAAYVKANSSRAELAAAVGRGFQRSHALTVSDVDCDACLGLAAPPTPNATALQNKLAELNVPANKRAALAALLIYGMRVFTRAKDSTVKPAVTGTAVTTAKFGFINLPAEVIAGLMASDGGRLRWLGTSTGTKDYMHFDFRDNEHPKLF